MGPKERKASTKYDEQSSVDENPILISGAHG
jgi:hypothetical protein